MKKKFTILIAALALLTMGVLPGRAVGQSSIVTFDATTDITANASSYQTTELTINANDGSTWKANGYGATANTNIVIGKGGANYLETPNVSGNITSVAVTWSGNTNYYLALQTTSGTELEAKSNPSTSTTETFTVSGSYTQLRLVGRRASGTSNAAATITKVVVTYSSGGGSDTYAVTYNSNGATSGSVPTDSNEYSSTNNTVTVAGNTGGLEKTGYDWSGWCLNTGGTGDVYGPDYTTTYTISGNTTFYAKWTAHTHNITMPSNDEYGTYEASATTDVPYGTTVTLTYTPETGYENYDATWTVNGDAISGNTFSMPDADVTVGVTLANYVKDQVDIDFAGVSSGGYTAWSDKTGTSGAVYAGKTAGSLTVTPHYIQMTNNSSSGNSQYSGIITTGSGGKIKKVVVTWATKYSNSNGRYLTIYGKNTAYEATSDLYNSDNRGTELGRITYSSSSSSTTASLTISGDYKFVGLLTSGAMYFDKIDIYWEPTTEPSITANNVDIEYNATSGSIEYTINYGVEGGSLTAATTSEWLTLGTVGETVPFTCSANEAATERTATVTLTYTYGDNQTATKNVTVTQAGDPDVVDNISSITQAAPYAVRGTVVATNSRGFIMGDGTGYVYYYKGNGTGKSVGDIVKVSGTTSDNYGHILQFTSAATVETATTSSYNNTPTATTITEVPNYSVGLHLSTYFDFEGVLTQLGDYYQITLGETPIQISYPTDAQVTTLGALVNKTVHVKGYFSGINSSNKFTVMMESAEEVQSPDPVINANDVNIDYNATSGAIAYTISNPGTGELEAICDAEWISNIVVANDKVTFTTTINEGTEDRIATFTLTYTGADDKVVTVTQGHFVVDYAELPFEWDDTSTPTGITNVGVGTYTSSPYLKFDGTGDYIILKINERPGALTFDIKGNTFSDGTFKVQTSANGTDYTDLETYTTLSSTVQSEEFTNLGENVRYIKWIYTEKVNGNVALGNIALAEYVEPVASITVTPDSVEAQATGTGEGGVTEGSLTVTLENITITELDQLGVDFCDENGTPLTGTNTKPEWINTEFTYENEVYKLNYTIAANGETTERVAYFKVYEVNSEAYSNKVTVTQEAYVAPVASITVTPDSVEAQATGTGEGGVTEGSLTVTLENITITELDQLGVDFCDENGTPLTGTNTKPEWINTEFTYENEVYTLNYTIEANTETTERIAYFKVYDIDSEVYSNKVTVTQAGAVIYYSVTFECNGGTFENNEDFPTVENSKLAGDYTLPSATKDGFTFAGWNDGTNTHDAGASYTVSSNVTFTAQWSSAVTATITFGSAEGSTNINSTSVTGDDSAGNTWTITTVFSGETSFTPNSEYAQIGSSKKPASSITFTTTLENEANITAFSAKFGGFSDTEGDITLKVGETTVGTGALNASTDVIVTNTNTETVSGTVLTVTVTNISKGVKCYYISYTYEVNTDPALTANNVNIESDATEGVITYTLQNPVQGGALSAEITAGNEGSWLTLGSLGETLPFTCTANNGDERTATVTFTYTYENSKESIQATTTITQAAAPSAALYSYSVNGVEGAPIEGSHVGDEITLAEGVDLDEEYTFAGWTTDPDNVSIRLTGSYTLTEDVTVFYAVYAKTVTSTTEQVVVLDGTNFPSSYTTDITSFTENGIGYTTYGAKQTSVPGNATNYFKTGTAFIMPKTYLSESCYLYNTSAFGQGITKFEVYANRGASTNAVIAINFSATAIESFDAGAENTYTGALSPADAVYDASASLPSGAKYFWLQTTSSSNAQLQLRITYNGSGTTTAYYTRVYDASTASIDIIPATSVVTVPKGVVLTLTGTNLGDASNLIIEEGGQLIHNNPVAATIQRNVNGYPSSKATGKSGYELIASPVISALNVATETNLTEGGEYDLYYFDQSQAHEEWRNYKKEQTPVPFTSIENGKGYLYANSADVTISFSGTLKPSDENVEIVLDYEDGHPFTGWNLVGNPFACNAYAFDTIGKSLAFYKMNDAGDDFEATTGPIAPMEGIFVYASATGKTFEFTRTAPASVPGKGNLNLEIAQVVTSRDAHQATDNAIIRFDGGNGLEKFSFNENNAKLYFPQNGKDYAVVSAEAQGEMPVYFKAAENGTYTIDFSMDNVEFSYLHLIDNKTGNDVDLLQTSSYTFEANTIDYASRFRLVFKAIGNENDSENNDFGFFDANGNLLILGIEGTATLQVMDVTGRTISSETFSGDYSKAINASAGVYMLRLVQGNDVRTQKIVVK